MMDIYGHGKVTALHWAAKLGVLEGRGDTV